MVLVNVLYFKDDWKDDPFSEDPIDDTFKLGNGQAVDAKFMESDDIGVGYIEFSDVEIVSVPFRNDDYYMVIVAPKENSGIFQFIYKSMSRSKYVIMYISYLIT